MTGKGIIIQARVGSTRLKNKILLPVEDQITFLDILILNLKKNFTNIPIILATSIKEENDVLVTVAKKHQIKCFRGDENNVLKRFTDCASEFNLDTIIRVCSDNPFLSSNLLRELLQDYQNEDYLAFSVNGTPSILTHYGFFAEIVSTNALNKILRKGNSHCQEHVTNCVYTNNEGLFNVKFNDLNIRSTNIRCTLDTQQDFENLKNIYFNWYKGNEDRSIDSLLNFLNKQEDLKRLMELEIKNNSK
ncbi:cytidylyltransferase domain-containing protein [Tenacibaculum sp. 190524A05c]|uniref:Spore coat polysaccharide biosynthesis protein SpsF n=1 Tax=Tenacibaculum platacis TaxID=3137852 RepID=A0ABM9NV93_9FLAO